MKFGFVFTHVYDKKKILLNLALLYLRNHNCESQKTFNPLCKPLRKQSLWREKWVNALLLQWSSSFHNGLKFILEKYSCFFYFLNSWSNFSLHMASEGKGMNWKSVTETVLNLLIHTLESRINILQWIFDLSTFVLRKFFDLRKNFTVPKILVHKMFDLRKISRNPFFDLRKKNQAF